jgi:hypothetical protein
MGGHRANGPPAPGKKVLMHHDRNRLELAATFHAAMEFPFFTGSKSGVTTGSRPGTQFGSPRRSAQSYGVKMPSQANAVLSPVVSPSPSVPPS